LESALHQLNEKRAEIVRWFEKETDDPEVLYFARAVAGKFCVEGLPELLDHVTDLLQSQLTSGPLEATELEGCAVIIEFLMIGDSILEERRSYATATGSIRGGLLAPVVFRAS
jgi:hypothetical protein